MRLLAPRPVLLLLTLVLVAGAIAFIELRLDAGGASTRSAGAQAEPQPAEKQPKPDRQATKKISGETAVASEEKSVSESSDYTEKPTSPERTEGKQQEPAVSDAERISRKEAEYPRAEEIQESFGLINTDSVSIKEAAGEKVVLLEFWTYTCFNCQNAQPHINALHEEYADDGLQVIGVHTPEFGFEKDIDNVREAVREANIEYPVVLDNRYATWNAYDQRFWPAWYLIDADGFVRYKHFGEGAYGETEKKVQELLAEKDRVLN
ncbi:MAG: redoxin domain-containing protein [Actinomycetota bacterium]|nr:redoxin domain-containing protein [Actinomycetota bacterium]